jgi:23S rRNA-intervening sequence protein
MRRCELLARDLKSISNFFSGEFFGNRMLGTATDTGEVCYQSLLARDLNYISNETYQELRSGYDRVIQMLSRLSQSLGNEPRTRSR